MPDAAPLLHLTTALALAWVLDRAFGEPPNRFHPVAWLGSAMAPLTRWLPTLAPRPAFWAGTAAWWAVVVGVVALAWALQTALLTAPAWWGVPALALLLKPSFAWRMLHDEVAAVGQALASEGLPAARQQVARLCSRDVSSLDEAAVLETAIETLAENFNDSLVAPLWWCALAGLPGAWAWRAINTLDASWGYRGRWEQAGKWAARADDVAAWLPARLSALLLWPGPAWRRLPQEARRTPSPNGGWPMAAMALHLGVRLGKPGVYRLNAEAPPPQAADLQAALAHGQRAAWAAAGLTLAALAGLALAIHLSAAA
jgi:adenosylcobinamide-phosphate synthase